ncbi:MAG: restriction endonuclease subunit S [Anaerolineae bacterium]|nr:restriction endonuclease subunit S [Anaerolineae bacterium]
MSENDLGKYRLQKGDVLFNNTNSAELVGKTALFTIDDGDYVFSNHLTRLRTRSDIVRPGWLAFYLRFLWTNRYFERAADRWIGQAAVRDDVLRSLTLPLPPADQQDVLLARLEAQMLEVARLCAAAERQLEAAQALPRALLNEIFGGFEVPTE